MSQLEDISIQYYKIFFKNVLFSLNYSLEYFYSLITLNAFVYSSLLVFFFSIFFLFDSRAFKTLSEYKFFKSTTFVNTTLVVVFFSLAGVPPFLGFFTKFLLFSGLFFSNHFFFFLVFLVLNLFMIFFYIQNTRFLINKVYKNVFVYFNYKVFWNFSLISIMIFFNFLNMSALIFFEYLLVWVYQFSFYINIQ